MGTPWAHPRTSTDVHRFQIHRCDLHVCPWTSVEVCEIGLRDAEVGSSNLPHPTKIKLQVSSYFEDPAGVHRRRAQRSYRASIARSSDCAREAEVERSATEVTPAALARGLAMEAHSTSVDCCRRDQAARAWADALRCCSVTVYQCSGCLTDGDVVANGTTPTILE